MRWQTDVASCLLAGYAVGLGTIAASIGWPFFLALALLGLMMGIWSFLEGS